MLNYPKIQDATIKEINIWQHMIKIRTFKATAYKVPVFRVYYIWSVYSTFGMNTEIHKVNLRIQSECWKIRKNSEYSHFSHRFMWSRAIWPVVCENCNKQVCARFLRNLHSKLTNNAGNI